MEEGDTAVIGDRDAESVPEEPAPQAADPEPRGEAGFVGTAEIRLVNKGSLNYGDEITLKADVRNVNLEHRLVWEANDHDGRGWFSVGSGDEYRFILERDNAQREYRVAIIAVG